MEAGEDDAEAMAKKLDIFPSTSAGYLSKVLPLCINACLLCGMPVTQDLACAAPPAMWLRQPRVLAIVGLCWSPCNELKPQACVCLMLDIALLGPL